MNRLPPLPFRRVERALRRLGFVPTRQRGSHVIVRNPDGRRAVVPRHAREDIGPGLLRKILREAGIDPADLLREA